MGIAYQVENVYAEFQLPMAVGVQWQGACMAGVCMCGVGMHWRGFAWHSGMHGKAAWQGLVCMVGPCVAGRYVWQRMCTPCNLSHNAVDLTCMLCLHQTKMLVSKRAVTCVSLTHVLPGVCVLWRKVQCSPGGMCGQGDMSTRGRCDQRDVWPGGCVSGVCVIRGDVWLRGSVWPGSVCDQGGVTRGPHPQDRGPHPPPPKIHPTREYGQCAVGTHPTGMHSCLKCFRTWVGVNLLRCL